MFKSLSLVGLLVVSLAALSGCVSSQAASSDEQLEPNASLIRSSLAGEWEVTMNPPPTGDDPPKQVILRYILIEAGNNRVIGASYTPGGFDSRSIVGIKNGNTITLYGNVRLEGQMQSRNSIGGVLYQSIGTNEVGTGTWSMTRIR